MNRYEVEINEKRYKFKSGWVYKDNYNEKLDSAVIVIENKDEIDLKPFDFIKIFDKSDIFKYFLVDNYVREITQFSPYKKYKYTINLMSLVKYLERITLPSMSITKPINASRKSVYFYIKNIFTKYMPKYKVKFANQNTWHYEPIIKIDNEFKTRFENVPCPDFSWNNPTLKEVLDDLCMVDDCICNVRYRFLTFMPLNNQESEIIDMSHIYNEVESMSSSDFSSDLDITMKNAIGENKMIANEYASARSEGGTLTTDNMAIYTQHPIYNIKSIKACFVLKYINFDTAVTKYAYVEAEIAPLIKEQEEFNILNGAKDANAYTFEEASKYKKYCLYYKRGDNKILNLGTSTWFFATLDRILDIACKEDEEIKNKFANEASGNLRPQRQYVNDIRDIGFIIEYETLADHKMKVGKYLPTNALPNSIFDNQTGSYVDIKNQANFEYSKINRLGNKIHTIEGKYKSFYDIPNLADKYHDEILFSREIMFYDDCIYFKGYLTKNYILKDYFTGVMSKRRSWAIAKNEEALTRYDISKFYVEFSYQEKVDDLQDELIYAKNESLMQMLLSDFDSDGYTELKSAVVYTKNYGVKYPISGYGYTIDFNVESQGMSLCLNFGFNDNYSVGNYIFKEDEEYRNGIYKYTDEYGNITDLYIEFSNDNNASEINFEYPTNLQTVNNDQVEAFSNKLTNIYYKKPLVFNSIPTKYLKISLQVPNYYKDSREILQHTLQFEYCSDTDEIIVSPEFVKELYLANQKVGNYRIFVNTSSTNFRRYHIGDTKPIGVQAEPNEYGIAVNYNYDKQQFSASITLETYFTRPRGWNIYTWGIVDENGKLMFGVNVRNRGTEFNPDPILKIFANLLKYRDDNVYDLFDKVIGKMWDYPKQ